MRLLRAIALAVLVLAFPACNGTVLVRPRPKPTPTPTPPKPPPPKPPPPAGKALTAAEYDSVALGSPSADLTARFGPPWRQNPVGPAGTIAWLYPAKDATGADLIAEFWVLGGRVTNKNRL